MTTDPAILTVLIGAIVTILGSFMVNFVQIRKINADLALAKLQKAAEAEAKIKQDAIDAEKRVREDAILAKQRLDDEAERKASMTSSMTAAWRQTLETLRQELATEKVSKDNIEASLRRVEEMLKSERKEFEKQLIIFERKVGKLELETQEEKEHVEKLINLFIEVLEGLNELTKQLRKLNLEPSYIPEVKPLQDVGIEIPNDFFKEVK